MYIVTIFDDGKLGKQYIEDTAEQAVERACQCFEEVSGRKADDTLRQHFDNFDDFTEDCWGIYIGQPE